MTPLRLVLLLVVVCAGAVALLRRSPGDPAGPAAGSDDPVGRWRLDQEALLADLEALHKGEGPQVVAREQELARGVTLDMEIRGDGIYAYRTVAMGEQELCLGTWRREGERLLFSPKRRGERPVKEGEVEVATFQRDRILIRFAGKTFTLVRHLPGSD